jgi:hypothetical protein
MARLMEWLNVPREVPSESEVMLSLLNLSEDGTDCERYPAAAYAVAVLAADMGLVESTE